MVVVTAALVHLVGIRFCEVGAELHSLAIPLRISSEFAPIRAFTRPQLGSLLEALEARLWMSVYNFQPVLTFPTATALLNSHPGSSILAICVPAGPLCRKRGYELA